MAKEEEQAGEGVICRSDRNDQFAEFGESSKETRIRSSVAASRRALDAGAAVMGSAHRGRPVEGKAGPRGSLKPVALRLSALLGQPVALVHNWVEGIQVEPGQVALLENARDRESVG